MTEKRIIIIGAGLAGLSAGCYLQMNGYDTQIFESHNKPGGLCTSWTRGDYTIDGCMHGLLGSSPSHPLYHLWNEVIDMDQLQFHDFEIKAAIHGTPNQVFYEYSNLDALQKYMEDLSPEDKPVIEEFIGAVRTFEKYKVFDLMIRKPREFYNVWDYLKMLKLLPALRFMKKWFKISAHDFATRFQSPFLREAVSNFASPILFEIFVLAEMDQKRSGIHIGGSLAFSKLFEARYIELGGKICYNSRVSKINTASNEKIKHDKAIGITLENGNSYDADIIISAADGRTTIFEMLNGKYIDKDVRDLYETMEVNPSRILVIYGVNQSLQNLPSTHLLVLNNPLTIADGTTYNRLEVRIFNFDPILVPSGKAIIEVTFLTKNYDYWAKLRSRDKKLYNQTKQKLAENVIDILDNYFRGIKDKVEITDVVTPCTFNRYTHNWKGSTQGWDNANIFSNKLIKKELPHLANFYLIGQWVQPGGGVPNAFLSGRDLAQIICKKDHQEFKSYQTSSSDVDQAESKNEFELPLVNTYV